MADNLTFSQFNIVLGTNVFEVDGARIVLDCNALTGQSFTALTDQGLIQLAYNLLLIAGQTQTEINKTEDISLTSFSDPFYGTVGVGDTSNYQNVSFNFSAIIPLADQQVSGTN